VGSTTTNRNFSQGALQTTNAPLDAAIQGNGFFVIQSPSGATAYTRDGNFKISSSGDLTTAEGSAVQGWKAVNGVVNASGPPSNIQVQALQTQPPVATANMTITANLNATAAVNDTFSTPIQVVDSLGETHNLTATFTNTGPGAWSYDVSIPGADLTGSPTGPASMGSGNVTFDSSGNLLTPTAPGTVALTNGTALADGAATLNINWNLFGPSGNSLVTQLAQASASTGTSQDGVQAATITGVSIQTGGNVVATYSSGKQAIIAQIATAAISNPGTLVSIGNNDYVVTADTIAPSVGAPGTGQRGNIVGGSLEASNVDMATEFTNLIVFQRGYEANSKVITTISQMDQMLLSINP
jgi:flagellar hook protein FlgE